jgi:hypothetical protein
VKRSLLAAVALVSISTASAFVVTFARADEPRRRPDVMEDLRRCGCQFGTCPIMCDPGRFEPSERPPPPRPPQPRLPTTEAPQAQS